MGGYILMSITELSVKRPATIIIIVVLLLGLGIIGYTSLGADMLPSMNVPVITVMTAYNGAGAEEIKKSIVMPIEDAVSGISGIDTITSTARQGRGMTTITFTMSTNMNAALLDVQTAIDRVQGRLPADADKPVIFKVDLNAMSVMQLTISGTLPYDQIYNISKNIVQDLENLPNIGQVSLQGAYDKQLSVKLDKSAVEYYGINVKTVMARLASENTDVPAGDIATDKTDLTVRMLGTFKNIDDVKNMIIPVGTGGSVRLADIADVKFEYPANDQIIKLNGKNAIGISIQKQSDSNVVEAVNGVKKELEKIRKTLPKGVSLDIANDSTTSINASLSEIKRNLVEGILTTALVLFLFLRNWRTSLIVLIAIPTSLVSTFFLMYESHFTLNMMSLMGLSLCIGILVDDSIVVLENIQRHLGMGKKPMTAAIDGRREIGMAAVAITLCDIVVFAPVAFMSGMTGQMFKEFGLTVAFAALFSLFVSFTVTPMFASRLLKGNDEASGSQANELKKLSELLVKLLGKGKLPKLYQRIFGGGRFSGLFQKVVEEYKKFLVWSLGNRWKILCVLAAAVIVSIALLPLGIIKTEFTPQTDNSMLRINIGLNPGSSLAQTESKVNIVEKYLKTIPEVKSVFTEIGGSDKASGSITVRLVDKNKRKRSQMQIANDIRRWGGRNMNGVSFSISQASMGGGGFGFGGGYRGGSIQINLEGTDTQVLKDISYKIEDLIKSIPGIVDVNNSIRQDQNEIRVNIDRLACAEYGVSASDIASILRTSIAGSTVGVYTDNDGTEHNIVVSFQDNQIKTPYDIGSIKVVNSAGQQISMNQVASVILADSQKTISRQDRLDVVNISANTQNAVLGTVNAQIRNKLSALALPYGYTIKYGGNQQSMSDTFSDLGKALGASIVLIYMILVVLYESFMTPIVRMLSLPCAIFGAFVMLAVTGKTLNMASMIGLIMLDGLASKNGTLLIDYTNTLMKRGKTLREALLEAGVTRLRPIIMTSATMIFGMLPAALSLGEGSELKSGMAVIVIGGMVTSTILTPIILPVVYTIIDDIKLATSRRRNAKIKNAEVQNYEA